MAKINNQTVILMNTLLSVLGLQDEKQTLVLSFSEGRSESSKDLEQVEANQLCRHLQELKKEQDKQDGSDKMRKKIIGLLKGVEQIKTERNTYEFTNEDGRANMRAIYRFILNVGYAKKGLNHYSKEELVKLVSQVEQITKTYSDGMDE